MTWEALFIWAVTSIITAVIGLCIMGVIVWRDRGQDRR
jgi:cbb3-type cytochrome oxidase subunit 3